jgi:hypothetical protein
MRLESDPAEAQPSAGSCRADRSARQAPFSQLPGDRQAYEARRQCFSPDFMDTFETAAHGLGGASWGGRSKYSDEFKIEAVHLT